MYIELSKKYIQVFVQKLFEFLNFLIPKMLSKKLQKTNTVE